QHDERGAGSREQLPAADPVPQRQDDLSEPLLVDPPRPGDRVGTRGDGRQRTRGEDLVTGTDLVGEVDRGQRDEQGEERRQRQGDDHPQPVEREPHRADATWPDLREQRPKVRAPAQPTAAATSRGRIARAPSSYRSCTAFAMSCTQNRSWTRSWPARPRVSASW